MAVLGILSYALEVPSLEAGVQFLTNAGLSGVTDGRIARFRCAGQNREAVTLIQEGSHKRLHHVTLRADELEKIARDASANGGSLTPPPEGFGGEGLWIKDPHGVLFHVVERMADPELEAGPLFEINAPGRIVRTRRSAIKPSSAYSTVQPQRLGHVLLFSPDVTASVKFVVDAFGMGLADRAQDVIAFTCARRHSDHHVLAFAKSTHIGFHHGSFQVRDPDEVGRAGRDLLAQSNRGGWGFGRHTIGSNFFHYIQDPWGSWFEYYSDLDYIDDYAMWTPTNYVLNDALASWGPKVPSDFVHNYEAESARV